MILWIITEKNKAELLDVESQTHGAYTTNDDMKAVMKLCAGKRINLKAMIEETHSPAECAEIYNRLINDKNFPTVVQFNWEGL